MTKTLYTLLLGLLVGLATQLPAHAQLSIDATAGYGLPTEPGSRGIFGGGLGVKHYFSSKLAVGGRIRGYSETLRETTTLGSNTLTAVTIPVMASIQYYPNEWDLHPYVGMEVGVIQTLVNAKIVYNDRKIFDDTMGDTSFGFAPKIGIGYDVSQGLAITGEFLYNIGFSKNLAGATQLDLKSSTKFPTVHLGISYTFGNRFVK